MQAQPVNLVVEELPELETSVAISNTSIVREVAGALCLTIAAGIAIGLSLR